MLTDLRHRLMALFRRAEMDRDLDEELSFHLEEFVRFEMSRGLTHEQALRQARMKFGTRDEIREEHREARGITLLQDFWRDLQFAVRSLRRTPGASAIAVLSLAVSIGATAAVYGTVDWLLNRPPGGMQDPDRVVVLNTTDRDHPEIGGYFFSYEQYLDLIGVQDVFPEIATYAKWLGVASTDGPNQQAIFESVSGKYFAVLGVGAAIGRTLLAEDDVQGAPLVAMVSERFWRSYLGGGDDVLHRTIRLNGHPARIVGVVSAQFEGFNLDWNGPTDVWIPLQAVTAIGGRILTTSQDTAFIPIVGRLPASVNLTEAVQKAQAWLPQIRSHSPVGAYRPTGIVATRAGEMRIGRRERAQSFLYTLLAVCILLMLAACFNVANFLIGRAISRRDEFALRSALGASRWRQFRQLFTEAALLGAGAAASGVIIAALVAHLLADLPRIYLSLPASGEGLNTRGAVDIGMAAATILLSAACVLMFGLLPAALATFRNPMPSMRSLRTGWGWSGMRLTTRQTLLILQVALAVALSIVAGLYAQSFRRAARIDVGYERPEALWMARVLGAGTSPEANRAYAEALLVRLNQLPQVQVASLAANPPFAVGRNLISRPGEEGTPVSAPISLAGPRHFETLGIPLLAGSEFTLEEETVRTGLIVNRLLAERLWPDTAPIGQPVMFGTQQKIVTGVVEENYCAGPTAGPTACAWLPFAYRLPFLHVRLRTNSPPEALDQALRDLTRELNPETAVTEQTTLQVFLKESTASLRLASVICGVLALLGVCLLAIGAASLFVSMVRDSRREIAIRMAVGADGARLVWRIVSQGLYLAFSGVLFGILGGWAIAQRIADQLFETATTDPLVFVGAPALVALAVVFAVGFSARIATRTNPVHYLRGE